MSGLWPGFGGVLIAVGRALLREIALPSKIFGLPGLGVRICVFNVLL